MAGLAEFPRDLVTLEEWDALELDEARRWELVEGGIVTDRHFRFRGDARDFKIGDCAFLRTGLLF